MKQNLDFKEKCKIIRRLGKEYKKAKIFTSKPYVNYFMHQGVRENSTDYLSKNEKDREHYENLIKLLDMVLGAMDKEYSIILRNDYFESQDSNWWLYYYSRSTYYRLKGRAMDEFMEAMYDLQMV